MEIFEIVDPGGGVIGTATREECHRNPELLHQAVHVLVYTSAGDLVLQKRNEDKDIQPGKWDSSVGGHVSPGEALKAAAQREAAEELGLSAIALEFTHSYIWRSDRESELVTTYRARSDGPFIPQPEEIDEVRPWSADEINQALGSGIFTPNFEHEWTTFCRPEPGANLDVAGHLARN